MGKKKKLIFIGIGALLALVIAGVILAICISGDTAVSVDPASDDFDEEYTQIKRVDADEFMTMDGVLNEPQWTDKQVFTNRFSDDQLGTKANFSMTTHMTKKGVYVGINIYDSNIVCDGLNAPRKNSTMQLYITSADSDGKTGIHQILMDAKHIVSTSNANVSTCAYAVKVDGEIGSGMTQKMTMELFLPWSAIGMEVPEDPDTAVVLLNPLYNAIEQGQTTSKQLKVIPFSSATPAMFQRFSQVGFVDMDAENAPIGNSVVGAAKAGAWDLTGLTVNDRESDEHTISLDGAATTLWGRYNLAYLTQASATNYMLEATVVPLSFEDTYNYNGFVGLAAMLPGDRQVSLRMIISDEVMGTNSSGKKNFNNITISRVYQDYQNGVYDSLQVVDMNNSNYQKKEGVSLKLIKYGAQYFMYAEDVLVWAGTESRGGSVAYPSLFSYNCQVSYKDIHFENYDGRVEELEETLLKNGTCLVSVETEGSGSVSADTIAVTKGGSVNIELAAMAGSILTDVQVNGKSVIDDFARNAYFEGIANKYTVRNITEHTVIKAIYEEYTGTQLSGKLSLPEEAGVMDMGVTRIYAYTSDKRVLEFSSHVSADGSYSISLPEGSYSKLYFAHTHYEQIVTKFADGSALKIGTEPVEGKDFTLTYPAFESFVSGPTLKTGDWYIVDNGKYYANGDTEANNYNTAYFRDSDSDDFVVKSTIKAEPGAMIGVMMNGTYKDNTGYQMLVGFATSGNKAITLFGWHGTARPVNWIGTSLGVYSGNAKVYPANNLYEVVVARKGDSLVMFVNGVQVAFWSGRISDFDGATFDMSQFKVGKVGLSLRGYNGATFSKYSYSTDQQTIHDLMCSSVTYETLPEGVTVQVDGAAIPSGEKIATGKTVDVAFPTDNGKAYCVTVNGKAITHDCQTGMASFVLETDSVIQVTETDAYQVSGTVTGGYSGSVLATDKKTGAKYYAASGLKDGQYTIALPNGSYKIYFDCGTREGMRNSTVVNGADLADQNLSTTYQKLYVEFMGGNPASNTSGITSNGVYYLCGAKNGNSNTIGYFNKSDAPVNNFVVKTHVNLTDQAGIMMYGYDGDKNNPDVQVNIDKNGNLRLYGWGIGWKDIVKLDTTTYDPTSFELCVVKNGGKLFVFIDGNLVHTWDGSGDVKISQLTDLRVGLLVRGTSGATFSGYSMSSNSSDIYGALSRKLTFDLPDGFKVTANGKTLKSGSSVAIGTNVVITLPENSSYMYAVTVNGKPLEVSYTERKSTFVMEGQSVIAVDAQKAYTVSGSVPSTVSGSIIATDTLSGQVCRYDNILSKGTYSILLPDGNYKLHFDCGITEGMLTDVTVNGADLKDQNLSKVYQKLLPHKQGDAGSAQWVLTDNGRYEVQTSNSNVNAVSMGYFADGVDLSSTDFVIHTNVEASGSDAVLLGLTVSNSKETVVYGLNNANDSAQLRVLMANGWPGYQALGAYDRTNFQLTAVKRGSNVYYFINGEQVAKWTAADFDISTMKNAKVGLGIYRMYDVVFSDYSYSTAESDIAEVLNRTVSYGALPNGVKVSVTSGSSVPMGTQITVSNLNGANQVYTVTVNGVPLTVDSGKATFVVSEDSQIVVTASTAYTVSGTVAGNYSGDIIATEASGAQQVFAGALVNGQYSIRLGDGTYRLYFDCGAREGVITGVAVDGEAVAVSELTKTYQKLTPEKVGGDGTANWVMTENGRYQVQTSNTNVNSVAYGWFAEGVDLASTDFVIKTRVEAAGNKAAMIGLVIGKSNETVVYGLNNSNSSAQIRVLQANGWPGYYSVAAYDRTNFELTIVKKGETITYYIDGVQAVKWTKADYDFSGWTNAKVGLGLYRMYDVTFCEYSYSTEESDIAAVNNRTVTYGNLPEGVCVSVTSGSSLPIGTEVNVTGLTEAGVTYTVLVNGQPVTVADGMAILTLSEDCVIEVIAVHGFGVSGTVEGELSGSVTAIDSEGGKQVFTDALVNGHYSVQLSDGTYSLYFDCGEREGMVTGVTVSGSSVQADLAKTYQKLTALKVGGDGSAQWVLTDNGRYEVQTSNTNVNSVTMGYFSAGVDLSSTDFVIHTNVEAAGNKAAMIGLVINNGSETVVYGLNNSNQSAQIRVLMANGWPGYRNVASYDRTNFELTIVKQGSTVTYYIDGVQACQWTSADYNFSGWTNAKVGIGVYRMYDVTFSEYCYTTENLVTGTVGEGLNGTVTATDADGQIRIFDNALVDGSYCIDLPDGTYSLHFDCGDTEGRINNVDVSGGVVTANLEKTYQKLTVLKAGIDGTADWVLTDNGRYEVQTSNTNVNSVTMGYFSDGVNLAATDFVIKTRVEAAGTNAVMMGLVINNGSETVVYGLNNSNQSAQIRVLMANGWPGYRNVATYDRTDFELTIVKKGTTVTYYIDGVQACQWTSSDYNFSSWSNAKVGIGFYRMYDVTFSDYSYSIDADDIAAAVS